VQHFGSRLLSFGICVSCSGKHFIRLPLWDHIPIGSAEKKKKSLMLVFVVLRFVFVSVTRGTTSFDVE